MSGGDVPLSTSFQKFGNVFPDRSPCRGSERSRTPSRDRRKRCLGSYRRVNISTNTELTFSAVDGFGGR